MSLNLTQLRLIVTRYIPQTLQTQLQLLLEVEPELHVFLAQQFDVPAVLLKFPLQFLHGLPHPPFCTSYSADSLDWMEFSPIEPT
jgi:hypothetical protein